MLWYFSLLSLFETSHNNFYHSEIPNQEDVHMASGQGWGGNICGADNEINRNAQRIRFIMIPADSLRTSMRAMRTTEATVTMLLEKASMPKSIWIKLRYTWKLLGL